jgi:hypothetical protein
VTGEVGVHDELLHLVGVGIKENILTIIMKRAKMETTIDDMLICT